jgi:hypothetical protein
MKQLRQLLFIEAKVTRRIFQDRLSHARCLHEECSALVQGFGRGGIRHVWATRLRLVRVTLQLVVASLAGIFNVQFQYRTTHQSSTLHSSDWYRLPFWQACCWSHVLETNLFNFCPHSRGRHCVVVFSSPPCNPSAQTSRLEDYGW